MILIQRRPCLLAKDHGNKTYRGFGIPATVEKETHKAKA